ncbi:MAG: substrate-binding domain-containing protein [Phycisphaeraceae bacterium]
MPKPTPDTTLKRIAVVMSLHHSLPWHHEPYHGIRRYADEQGWDCVVDPHMLGVEGRVDFSPYDGVVGRITNDLATQLKPLGIPVVSLTVNTVWQDIPGVRPDPVALGRLTAEHFLAQGYRRVALVLLKQYASLLDYEGGLAQVMAKAGFPPPKVLEIVDDFEHSRGTSAQTHGLMTDWLAGLDRPVGVLIQSVISSRYFAEIARELGLRVPDDVGIVSASGAEVVMTSNSPTLSSVEEDFEKQGYQAASMLDDLMQGRPVSPLRRTVPPKRLVVRESSDVFLCEDPLVSEAMRTIAERAHTDLFVDELAEAIGSSRRTLERRFEDVLGRSVHSEIRRLRAEHIKRLLEETDRSIGDIAISCGFDSASHFARFFKREIGQTPSGYRKLRADRSS